MEKPNRLPCGATAYGDGAGVRCSDCLLIYGSVAWLASSCPKAVERRHREPAAAEGCLRTIVRTGQREQDRLAEAIEAASFEDVALFAIAMNRKNNEGDQHADANLSR